MAVKGSATVTLSQYRDTDSVTRYYKLQSSSMAAPDKPTNVKPNETPAGWSKAEPACDITKTLYTCDVTVFSDKTTHVSDVSKSTSYEAAKEAWNKANNAQGTANEAAKTADNYISADSTGIMVSENKGAAKETPSNATKNNVLITEKDVQIRNGQKVVASYGESVIIGKNESNNIRIKDTGFSINDDGNEMFAVEQEDTENNYIGEFVRATYDASTDTCSLESSYKAYYPNRLPVLYVIHRDDTEGDVSEKETIQYGDTKLPCTVSITEAGKYLVKFKKTDWDKSWENMSPGLEMNYYAVGGGAKVTIGTRTDYGLANNGSWSLTVGSSNTAENRSITVGKNNRAKADSVAIGNMAIARNSAIAVGSYAKATNYNSAAIGYHVRTDKMNQLIVGQYNRETTYSTLFAAGCGKDTEPANAAAITATGDVRIKGTVYIGCEKDSSGGIPLGTVISGTGTAKATGGSVEMKPKWWRCGNLVQMEFRVAATGAVKPGENIATGTITGIPRPVTTTGLRAVSYYGNNANVSLVSQNGGFTVRNCGSDALAKGNDAIGIFTYITDGTFIGGSGTGAQLEGGA